jgi:hypothetical protein
VEGEKESGIKENKEISTRREERVGKIDTGVKQRKRKIDQRHKRLRNK